MKSGRADFIVIGAGVFGAWIAYSLRRPHNSRVTLIDAYGPGNSRSSSGDESRIIRMGYGSDALYTRWAARSLQLWQELFRATNQALFIKTGVLWLGTDADIYSQQMAGTLAAEAVAHEKLLASEIAARFPQIGLDGVSFGIFEPNSGVLLARRSVQTVVDEAIRSGVEYVVDAVLPPECRSARLENVRTCSGQTISGGAFLFACGPWLPQVFPQLLCNRLFPTRQEVFFFSPPAGTTQFRPPALPVWLHHEDEMYGLPDIENRGIKIACDRRGEAFDPETGDRVVSERGLREIRTYMRRRLPELQDAPVVESRVCQYENTSNRDFLIDRHPQIQNVWLVGGGSGHGFKHGPAVGQHVTERILGAAEPEPRFSIERKLEVQQRAIE